jgi:hypothetical protein
VNNADVFPMGDRSALVGPTVARRVQREHWVDRTARCRSRPSYEGASLGVRD